MSQERLRRPEAMQEPIKYGDVFDVQGELAGQTVAPRDAAMMQSAENRTFGYIQKGGPASVMQAAANRNERAGLVGHDQVTRAAGEQGVAITEVDRPGERKITESIAGQVVGQEAQRAPLPSTMERGGNNTNTNNTKITIGEALEATAWALGDRPVDYSDAAAVQAAEVRATGSINIIPGGVAAAAQSAATRNARMDRDENKTRLGDILADASMKLPGDKPVIGAEVWNDPNLSTHPGGVAASVAAAATLNQGKNQPSNNQNY